MHLGIVKILGPDNKTIPECPYPLDDTESHEFSCLMGVNMYTKQEHTGFNVNTFTEYGKEKVPLLPENTTFLAGKSVSKKLDAMGIFTPEDILAHAHRITASYTREPYPGFSIYYPTDLPSPSWPLCIPCHSREVLAKHPVLKVRGLCSQTAFDREYTMLNDEDGYVKYVGNENSIINYDAEKQIWKIQSLPFPKITATSKAIFSSLFLGKHTWHISNDRKCQTGEVELSVKLSTCDDGEFTCGNGFCINLNKRCDKVQHCNDWSDEIGCSTLEIPQGYLKEFVPIKLMEDETISKAEVIVSASIIDVTNIFEKEGSIGFRIILSMEWKDARVGFRNLRKESKRNLLSKLEMQSVWVPSLVFYNTLNEEETVLDSASNMFVNRSGGFVFAPADVLDEATIFKGSENSFIHKRSYMKTLICEFNMEMYPFDTQRCIIDLRVKQKDDNVIDLAVGDLNLERNAELMQYMIIKYEMMKIKSSNVVISLTLGRKILSQVLTIYLPSVLIIIVVYSTNFLKQFFFEAIVSVNLTAMLVLTTIFLGVSGDLPTTSYVKYVEVWLIFCLFVPFIYVLLHIYIDNLRVRSTR